MVKNYQPPVVDRLLILAAWLALHASIVAAEGPKCPEGEHLVIRGATVFMGSELQATAESIVVRHGRIEAVIPPGSEEPEACRHVLDAEGMFAIPGLWDLHVHVSKATPGFLQELPRLGITGVRDMGSSMAEIEELRRRIRDGLALLPHLSSPGPMFETPGGESGAAEEKTLEPRYHTRRQIPADDSMLETELRALGDRGADFAKLRSAADAREYVRFVEIAHRLNLPVATHPPPGLPPAELPAGVLTIEHASYPYPIVGGEEPAGKVAAALREAGVTIVPTLTAWKTQVMDLEELTAALDENLSDPAMTRLVPPRLAVEWGLDLSARKPRSTEAREGWQGFYSQLVRDLRALHAAGVVLAAGSDVGVEGVVPGKSLFEELCALETEVGIDPLELLRVSTVVASRIAGREATTGSIAPGKSADLLLLREDPRSSTRALASLAHVVLRGHPITVEAADRALIAGACPR